MAIDEKGRYTGKLIGADDTAQIGSAERPAVIEAKTITASGAITASGGVVGNISGTAGTLKLGSTNLAAGTQAVTVAQTGQIFIGAVDAVFTLPLATVGAGVYFTFVTGVASAGTGLRVTAVTPDDIFGAGVDTAAAGSITNSGATDVIGDTVTLVSDGVSRWTAVVARGIWA